MRGFTFSGPGEAALADLATMCVADAIFGYGSTRSTTWTVDGRSLSEVARTLMIAIGPERFAEFLTGAWEMDRHFVEAPLAEAVKGHWRTILLGCGLLAATGRKDLARREYEQALAMRPHLDQAKRALEQLARQLLRLQDR